MVTILNEPDVMRLRKSFLLLLNLIFSTSTSLWSRVFLFGFLLSCHHRHKSAHTFLGAASPSGEGVSEMCAKCSGVCHGVMAGVKGENRACRMGSDLFVQMVSWGLKHTSCVGMSEICPLNSCNTQDQFVIAPSCSCL